MKKLILISIIALLVLSPIFVSAQTDLATMKPGITPDSPFYFLDKWGEKINLFFIFSSETKAEKALQFAEERIAEVKSMAEKNNVGAMQSADNNYQELIALANQKTQEAKDNGKNVEELASLITEKTLNHQEILAQVFEKVPEEAKVAIEQAIKTSRNGSEEAVKAVSGDKKDELLQKMEDVKSKITEKLATLEEKIIALEQKIEEKNTNKEAKKEIKNEEKVNGNQPQISQQNQQEQNTTNHSPQNTLNQIQQNTQQIIQNTNQITQNTQQIIQNTTPPICAPDWECDSWNTCLNSQQVRVCSDLNNCGVATGKPSEIKSCVVVCTPNWQCADWNTCSNSTQTRTCTDSNSCEVTTGKPAENQSCINPVQTPVCLEASLQVTTASSSPFSATISINSDNAKFTTIKFSTTKGNQGGRNISKLIITREGGADDMFSNVSLRDGGAIISSAVFNNGKAEFNLYPLLSIPDDSTKIISIYAQLNPANAVVGTSVRLGINNVLDITAPNICDNSISTSVSIGGTAMGNYMILVQ